ATITLVGTNSATGIDYQSAGIQIGGSGTTLTITGDGSLTANGGAQSAGIGLSCAWDPANDVIGGDIVIEGGNITASGGSEWGAGIGTGVVYGNGNAKTARIGNITIKGGSVKATGGSDSNGIGTGYTYSGCTNAIGTVTIYDGIDLVDASSIKDFGNVVYMHVDGGTETNVTASKTDYFTISESGNHKIITPPHTHSFTYSASGATITATCSNDCPLTNHQATLTINAPTGNLTYDSTAKAATLTGLGTFNTATGLNVGTTDIVYFAATKNGNTYTKSGNALTGSPTGAGDYIAEITLQSKAASVGYTIAPKEVSISWGTAEFTYDGTEHCPTATAGNLVGTDSCTVTVTGGQINANVDGTIYTATATGLSNSNYKLPSDKTQTFTIAKADVAVTAPTAKTDLTYTGSAQALVEAGSATGGTMWYAVTTENTEPYAESYTTSIPTATNAGTYYVWYKVVGDSNHYDSAPQSIDASIGKDTNPAAKTVDSAVEAQIGTNVETKVNLGMYLGDASTLAGSPLSSSESSSMDNKITFSDIALTGNTLTFKTTCSEGGEGKIILTVDSSNYKGLGLTIPVKVQAKTTEVVVESSESGSSGIQGAEVKGLSDYTNEQNGTSVKVVLDVKSESAPEDNTVKSNIDDQVKKVFINTDDGSTKTEYIELNVTKQVNSGSQNAVDDVGRVIEISLKYDLAGKFNPVVIREHKGAVKVFTELDARPDSGYVDGTYYVDRTNNVIYIYSQFFSTYSIAYATASSYKVTFDAQGGSEVAPMIVKNGGTISTLPTTTKSGYTFDGWFTAATGGTQLTTTTVISDNAIYYAHWTKNSSGGGGSGGGGGSSGGGGTGGGGGGGSTDPETTKTPAEITKAPKAITNLVYTGKAQALITAGEAKGGTMYYAVTTSAAAPAASAYKTTIPTGKNAGTYYVYYMAKGDNDHTDTAANKLTVSIKKVAVKSVKLNKKKATVVKGYKITLKATVSPKNATNQKVTWKSSNKKIATVSSKGVVTGKKKGTVKITVTTADGKKTASCTVTVKNPVKVKSVKLNKTKATVKKGKTLKLKATIAPKNATNTEVTWKSSKPKIAKVDKNGKVTALKKGTTTITVTTKDGKKKATCKVTVK
ncbi:MAG: Ig-like domain-containing protein, partial [Lachnospiraceae bacterium]|nr:Ig-like domain-containing protein [Lachnospiraceae bacterium]